MRSQRVGHDWGTNHAHPTYPLYNDEIRQPKLPLKHVGQNKRHIAVTCSVTQSCPTLCEPIDCSTPGFPVLHNLPEFAQTHVRWASDASNHLILYHSFLLLPSIFCGKKIREFKDIAIETQREKRIKTEQSSCNLWDNFMQPNLHVIGVLGGSWRKKHLTM